MAKFDRAIDDDFVAKLKFEADRGGWWADVLADHKLFVALRGKYLNVYWRGQSLFYVEQNGSSLNVTTHEKFLIEPGLKSQVRLTDGTFDVVNLREKGIIYRYEGPATLDKLKRASQRFAGLEKTGCHEIALGRSAVIDCEIAFSGTAAAETDGCDANYDEDAGRIDLACLQQDGDKARLVFWEAKHYSNNQLRADLRSDDELPPVCHQIKKYEQYISADPEAIVESYAKVARNLVQLRDMSPVNNLPAQKWKIIEEVGRRSRSLVLEPRVGLVIFGYDDSHKKSKRWASHLARLRANISQVKTWGDAGAVNLTGT
nr:hypothetical protein [uncultured Rhodopila sp.]